MDGKKTVLIVEDDPKILKALAIRLEAANYNTVTAMDAISGTAQAVRHQPDVVLLDISMPAGSGIRVAQNIQQNLKIKDTSIVFMTASQDPVLKKQAYDLGPTTLLEKPFESETLFKALEKATADPEDTEIPW